MSRREEAMETAEVMEAAHSISTQSSQSDENEEEDFHNSTRYQDEFKELGNLGVGSYGSVVKVKHLLDKKHYAVKRICCEGSTTLREARNLSDLQHPNIVRYFGSWRQIEKNCPFDTRAGSLSFSPINSNDQLGEVSLKRDNSTHESSGFVTDDGDGRRIMDCRSEDSIEFLKSEDAIVLFILMELCSLDLKTWLFERNASFNLGVMFDLNESLANQLFEGISYIHSKSIIHRDLKPANIFLDQDTKSRLKIGDFGLSKEAKRSSPSKKKVDTDGVGTRGYIAPEIAHTAQASQKSDMYSTGIVLFELFSGFKTEQEKFDNIMDPIKSPSLLNIGTKWPKQFDIISSLVQANPESRPAAKSILDVMLVAKTTTAKDKALNSI